MVWIWCSLQVHVLLAQSLAWWHCLEVCGSQRKYGLDDRRKSLWFAFGVKLAFDLACFLCFFIDSHANQVLSHAFTAMEQTRFSFPSLRGLWLSENMSPNKSFFSFFFFFFKSFFSWGVSNGHFVTVMAKETTVENNTVLARVPIAMAPDHNNS